VLLVSHDRVFLDRVVTSTLAFEGNGRVTEYVGGYQDYLRQRTIGDRRLQIEDWDAAPDSPRAQPKAQSKVETKPVPTPRAKPRKLSFKEQRELEGLPARIAALEEEQQRLKEEVASAEFYKSGAAHIKAVLARIDVLQVELDATLERWVELDAVGRTIGD
jgi:ATP-binding cassette subfamily F protein uup